MPAARTPGDGPPLEAFASVFQVREVRTDGDRLLYVGRPTVPADALEREVYPLFREHGYDVSLQRHGPAGPTAHESYALVARPQSVGLDGVPWTNLALALATVVTTLFVGSLWYRGNAFADPASALRAWPFTAAVLGVIGTHELGHYAMSRYHRVQASLPYFIPVPIPPFGTMGAVIKMEGRIPDRKALFDIGVAGPLVGLVATLVVTVIGLHLPPVENPFLIQFNHPPLLAAIAGVTGRQLTYADPGLIFNPVVFGGWLGAFLTFLNLLPVGQLDGGHVVRAMFGERTETIGAAVPAGLFGLGAFQWLSRSSDVTLVWFLWGALALGLAYAGPTTPISDEPLDRRRMLLGVATFLLGVACFTPVPVQG
ncbi:site-2 protease family protein [Halorientalis halophila]|uniref:site-2 protease family protein n=1 Tax=Halorientalis halophila TaxID=3108499 RepID=UPI003009C8AF